MGDGLALLCTSLRYRAWNLGQDANRTLWNHLGKVASALQNGALVNFDSANSDRRTVILVIRSGASGEEGSG